MNGISPCEHCDGNGFVRRTCGCREAMCPHESLRGDPTDEGPGLYQKYWVRRTDGQSEDGQKHENCHYFVLDLVHDRYAAAALRAYADACERELPELADDLRALAADAERRAREEGVDAR